MYNLFALFAFLLQVLSVEGACYKNCNKNGFCNRWSECVCFEGFTGFDCSKRLCPTGPQFGDIASATDTAHADVECSGRGTCNRGSGQCLCQDGYMGQNCARTKCANDCSNKGDCISLGRSGEIQDGIAFNHSSTYTLWDKDIIYGCKCEPGATGADCSQRLCEVGPDPRATAVTQETVTMTCTCPAGGCVGKVKFRVMGTVVRDWITPATTATALGTALSTSPPIFGVRTRSSIVSVTATSSTDGTNFASTTAICNAGETTTTKIVFAKQADMQYIQIYRNSLTTGTLVFTMAQTFSCDCTGGCAGKFRVSYDGEFSDALAHTATLGALETAVAGMATIGTTGATVTSTSSTDAMCVDSASTTRSLSMTADRAPLPLVHLHSTVHTSIGSSVASTTASVMTVASTDGRGAVVKLCSGIGKCDFATGMCDCPYGWTRDETTGGCGQPKYYNSDWHGVGRCPGLTSTALGGADLTKQKNVPFDRLFIAIDPSEWAHDSQPKSTVEYWNFASTGDPIADDDSRTLFATYTTDSSAGQLALDEMDNLLYMVDMAAGASFIARAPISSTTAFDVADYDWFTLGSTVVSAIALDPHWNRRRLYYSHVGTSESEASGNIFYLPLDTDSPSAVSLTSAGASQSLIVNPTGLAMHFEDEEIYFLDKEEFGSTDNAIKKCTGLTGTVSCSVVNTYTTIDGKGANGVTSSLVLKYANNTAIFADSTSDVLYQVPVTNTDFTIPNGDDTALRNQYLEYFDHIIAEGSKLGFTQVEASVQDFERNFVLVADKEQRKIFFIRTSYSDLDPFNQGVTWMGKLNADYLPTLNRMDTPRGLVLDKGLGPPYAFGDFTECYSRGECLGKAGNYQCRCYEGYTGDCQARTCPMGPAWFAEPRVNNKAHDTMVECSNAGLCDKKIGECTCFDGFQGAACERTVCSGGDNNKECTGRGVCRTSRELADKGRASDGNPATSIEYGTKPHDVSTWDADRTQGCLADYHAYGTSEFGEFNIASPRGAGLEELQCPTGLNRWFASSQTLGTGHTFQNKKEVQRLSCNADGGTFTVTFRGEKSAPIAFDATAAALKAALELLRSIGRVSVTLGDGNAAVCESGGATADVTFQTELSDLPLLVTSASALTLTASTATLAVATIVGGAGYELECGGKGVCNVALGECTCWEGWTSSDGYGAAGDRGDCSHTRSV